MEGLISNGIVRRSKLSTMSYYFHQETTSLQPLQANAALQVLSVGDQQPIPHSLNSLFDLHSLMSELEGSLYALVWNNDISVAVITLISYDYMLQLEKEVTFVWQRQWTVMAYLYLAVRYFGIFLAMIGAFWGGLIYMAEAPYV